MENESDIYGWQDFLAVQGYNDLWKLIHAGLWIKDLTSNIGQGTVTNFHAHSIEDTHHGGDVQQVEDDGDVAAKHHSRPHHVHQGVADLASSPGHTYSHWFSLQVKRFM